MKKDAYIPLAGLVLLLFGLIGYLIADIVDAAPGILTLKPPVTALGKKADYQITGKLLPASADLALPSGKAPTEAQLKPLIANLRSQLSAFKVDDESVATNARLGVVVLDTASGQVIAGYNAQTPIVPASSTKILAAVTALKELGADYRFETAVFQNGDRITLVAGGDIALGMDVNNPDLIYGRAGIASLAQETAQKLKAQGIRKATLGFDNSLFGDSRPLPAWVKSQLTGYTINPTAIAINAGAVPGGEAYSYYSNPPQAALTQFTAKLAAAGVEVSYAGPVTEKTLEKQIFPVGGTLVKDPKTKKIASAKGAALSELIYHTLKYSDNVMADSICRAATIKAGLPGSFDNQVKTVKNNLEKLGINTGGLQIQDCSGLSVEGKVSPELLANTIQTAIKNNNADLRSLYAALPRAGFDGTLRLRMDSTPAAGHIWAKTGTLSQASSLSGFVQTKSGALLTVVVLGDSYKPEFGDSIRGKMDEFLANLAGL